MKYIIYKRFKEMSICGIEANLPYGTECYSENDLILFNGYPLCKINSENAYNHFTQNEDSLGLERGKLIIAIKKKLQQNNKEYQSRWDKVWSNEICKKYKRQEIEEHWLWNNKFYNAPINDLKYIANLINAKTQ